MNGTGCLECCVEKDSEAANGIGGQSYDWLAMSVWGIRMETGTKDTHIYYSLSQSSPVINALLVVTRTCTVHAMPSL